MSDDAQPIGDEEPTSDESTDATSVDSPSPDDPFGLGVDELIAEAEPELDLEQVVAERDEYLDLARRVQADFENYKRRIDAQRVEQAARAAESLAVELLPVLDACDAALGHGADEVAPVQAALVAALQRKGLEPIDATDADFDPELHEAVMSEPGDGGENGPVVVEVLRAGYQWNGRVIRPAMVKVRG